jgi:hypothetical protein
MTTEQLITECKKGLNIPEGSTNFDGVIGQKVKAVQLYAKNAGASDSQLDTDLGTGLIVMGVTDIWNLQGGEIKFSPAFNTILIQLACASRIAE